MRRVQIQTNLPDNDMISLRSRTLTHDVEIGNNEEVSGNHPHTPRKPANMTCLCCFRQPLRLCTINEVPSWMARPHILTGYRPDLSFKQCIKSLAYMHNETGNIFSHLFGCVLVIYYLWYLDEYEESYIEYENHHKFQIFEAMELIPSKVLIIRSFLVAAAICMLGSSVYHTGNCCQDEQTCALLLRGDVSGIAILIASSFLPGVYFGFACFPQLQSTYLLLTCILLIVGLGVSLADACTSAPSNKLKSNTRGSNLGSFHMNDVGGLLVTHKVSKSEEQHIDDTEIEEQVLPLVNDFRKGTTKSGAVDDDVSSNTGSNNTSRDVLHRIRMGTFCGFVCLGLIVAIHWSMLVADEARRVLLPRFGLMIGFYALGFCFYFFHIPEKWAPGAFDYILHSHQLWHICVVAAIVVWFYSALEVSSLLINRGCVAFIEGDILDRIGVQHSSITPEEQKELNELGSNSSIINGMFSISTNGDTMSASAMEFASEINIHLHDAIGSMIQPATLRGSGK